VIRRKRFSVGSCGVKGSKRWRGEKEKKIVQKRRKDLSLPRASA